MDRIRRLAVLVAACLIGVATAGFQARAHAGPAPARVAGGKANPEIGAPDFRVGYDIERRSWYFHAASRGGPDSEGARGRMAYNIVAGILDGPHSMRHTGPYQARTDVSPVVDVVGSGTRLTVHLSGPAGAPRYIMTATHFPGKQFAIFDLSVINDSTQPLRVNQLSTWTSEGGLDLGPWLKGPPGILRDSDSFKGTNIRLLSGGPVTSLGVTALSNPAGGNSFTCGFLELDRGACLIRASPDSAPGRMSISAAWSAAQTINPGDTLRAPRLFVGSGHSVYQDLESYADCVRLVMNPPVPDAIPVLWTSWYSHRWRMTEKTILMNAAILDSLYGNYGFQYVQLDHGWQFGWDPGDGIYASSIWEANGRFPHGLPWLAGQLAAKGMKLGLWISPYAVNARDPIAREHPEAGFTPGMEGLRGDAAAVLEFLRDTGRRLKSYGAEYLKIDFGATRSGTDILRRELGPDVPFVASGSPSNSLIGCFNLMGAHRDVGNGRGEFRHLQGYLTDVSTQWFKNGRFWRNSVDALIVGDPEESAGEARVRCTIHGLSGANLMLGDNMVRLLHHRPDRLSMITTVLPPSGLTARPLDLFESAGSYPSRWCLPIETPWDEWTVLAIFNLGESVLRDTIHFEELGLPGDQEHLIFDFWREEFAGGASGEFVVAVPPGDVRLLALTRKSSRPSVMATNMHVTMGYVELQDVRWDSSGRRLSGRCERTPGAKGSIFVHVPPGFRPRSSKSDAVTVRAISESLIAVDLSFSARSLDWSVEFERTDDPAHASLVPVANNLLLEAATEPEQRRLLAAEARFDSLIERSPNLALASSGAVISTPMPVGRFPVPGVTDGDRDHGDGFSVPREIPAQLDFAWPEPVRYNTVVLYHSMDHDFPTDWMIDVLGPDGWMPVDSTSDFRGHPRMTVHTFPTVMATAMRVRLTPKISATGVTVMELEIHDLPPTIPEELVALQDQAESRRRTMISRTCFGANLAELADVRASNGTRESSLNNGNVRVTSDWWEGPGHPDPGWWSAGGREARVELEWSNPTPINMIVLHHPDSNFATDWVIESWNDGRWSTLASMTGYAGESYRGFDGAVLSRRSIHILPEVTSQKLRLTLSRNTPGPLGLIEVEAYHAHSEVNVDFTEFLNSERMTDGDAKRLFGK